MNQAAPFLSIIVLDEQDKCYYLIYHYWREIINFVISLDIKNRFF